MDIIRESEPLNLSTREANDFDSEKKTAFKGEHILRDTKTLIPKLNHSDHKGKTRTNQK
jgi:hypothetical protein